MSRNDDAQSWHAYWAGADAVGDSVTGGAKGEALDHFWSDFLETRLSAGARSMIDIACGAGPVSERAARIAQENGASLGILSTDYSPTAVRSALAAASKQPGDGGVDVLGFAGDGAKLPLRSETFDIVASQFGLEYAGAEAFTEAGRLIAKGGALAVLAHKKDGAIERECADNLRVIRAISDIGLLERARTAFDAGFAVAAGRADSSVFQEADKAFGAAVNAAKPLIQESPKGVARAFLIRIYKDLAHMYPRQGAYRPEEVREWLDRGVFELGAYGRRMSSMVDAARSDEDIAAICADWRAAGLSVADPDVLEMGTPPAPAAWIIRAERPGDR